MHGVLQWLTNLIQQVKLWAVVNPWERAIRVRLGKFAVLLEPGWHLRIPLVDSVVVFNTRLRIGIFSGQTLPTADGKTVTVAGSVGFRIENPLEAMKALQQPEISCPLFVQASLPRYITTKNLDEINVAELEECAKAELEQIAPGLAIEYVRITDFAVVSRTFRLLGDEWRQSTKPDKHDSEQQGGFYAAS